MNVKMRFKKKLSLLAAPIVLLAANTTVMADFGFCPTPYVGADFGLRHMGFKENRGAEYTRKNYPQGNVFLGLKFNDYVGIEAGFESTTNVRRTTTVPNSGQLFGVQISDEDPNLLNRYITTTRLYGWHADLVGFLPLCEEYCVSMIGSAGIARLRLKVRNFPTLQDGGRIPAQLPLDFTNFSKNKYVARLGVGLQQMVTNCAGVRLMVNWENTDRFKDVVAKENASVRLNHRVSAKDSFMVNLGVFYQF